MGTVCVMRKYSGSKKKDKVRESIKFKFGVGSRRLERVLTIGRFTQVKTKLKITHCFTKVDRGPETDRSTGNRTDSDQNIDNLHPLTSSWRNVNSLANFGKSESEAKFSLLLCWFFTRVAFAFHYFCRSISLFRFRSERVLSENFLGNFA